jgi:uncharacterized protein
VKPFEVEQAFRNDPVDIDFEVVDGEDRWTLIGHSDELRILLVAWTMRGDSIRVVTARTATKKYREAYLIAKGF